MRKAVTFNEVVLIRYVDPACDYDRSPLAPAVLSRSELLDFLRMRAQMHLAASAAVAEACARARSSEDFHGAKHLFSCFYPSRKPFVEAPSSAVAWPCTLTTAMTTARSRYDYAPYRPLRNRSLLDTTVPPILVPSLSPHALSAPCSPSTDSESASSVSGLLGDGLLTDRPKKTEMDLEPAHFLPQTRGGKFGAIGGQIYSDGNTVAAGGTNVPYPFEFSHFGGHGNNGFLNEFYKLQGWII
ncbi:hypothetical protein HDU84_003417 [Entophlyctis sp. JEL0112]|nr:hypothetical protein HDU84_003417 [Entophlyctis sp. JEL0112]